MCPNRGTFSTTIGDGLFALGGINTESSVPALQVGTARYSEVFVPNTSYYIGLNVLRDWVLAGAVVDSHDAVERINKFLYLFWEDQAHIVHY